MVADYIALGCRPDWPDPSCWASLRRDLISGNAWRLAWDQPGFWLFLSTKRPLKLTKVRTAGGALLGLVLGDIFELGGTAACELQFAPASDPQEVACALQSRFWGRYVAVLQDEAGRLVGAFRDPSGAIDCLILSGIDGTALATSALPPPLLAHVAPHLSVDWDGLGRQLADPGMISACSGFTGLDRLAPGGFRRLVPSAPPEQLWRPIAFVQNPPPDIRAAGDRLRGAVEDCVAAQAGLDRRIVAEVSGGLDSAVVASALTKSGAQVADWLHLTVCDPAADERVYAEALAVHFGIKLKVRLKRRPTFAPEPIAQMQTSLAPSLNGFDPAYDQDVLEVAGAVGADSIFTGMGGDAVFFQARTAVMIVDRVRRLGWAGLDRSTVEALARWDRRSAWSVLMAGLTGRSGRLGLDVLGSTTWVRPTANLNHHPWLDDFDDAPPGKRLHVKGVVQLLVAFGGSRRGAHLDIVHPLMSQPVLERAFETPVDWLVIGGRDRGLARRAFADRLPELILERRSKADLSGFYAGPLAAALPAIRDHLLDGLLVQHHLIDRAALEPVLDEAHLAHHGGFFEILRAVALEGWARHWTSELWRPSRTRWAAARL